MIGFKKKQSRYTCNFKGCLDHLWIRIKHKKENNDMLKIFKDEISSRYQLNFGLVAYKLPKTFFERSPSRDSIQRVGIVEKVIIKSGSEVENKTAFKTVGKLPVKVTSAANAPSNKSKRKLDGPDASNRDKLKKHLKKTGIKDRRLLQVPAGRAHFMIGSTQGKTRPLLTLYDTECGSVLFREGVPGN